jgi:hypothetical protein
MPLAGSEREGDLEDDRGQWEEVFDAHQSTIRSRRIVGSKGFGNLEIWRFGDLEIWRFGIGNVSGL